MKRFFLLLALGLTLCASAGAQKFAHLNRYAADNQALPPVSGKRVVLMGDSITDGWPGKSPEFFESSGFIGRGISGEESSQMLLRFRQDVIDLGATDVAILAGINDIAINLGDAYSEDLTFSNIVSMVELSWIHRIRPLICSVLPSQDIRWRPEITDEFEKVLSLNARLKAYCETHGVIYVDYFSAMVAPDGRGVRDGITTDTVHPNAEGYKIMERVLLDALK